MFTLPTLYLVNIELKSELHINVRRHFDLSKVRGKGKIVMFYKPGYPSRTRRGANLFFVFFVLTPTRDFSEFQISILLRMIICEILLFVLCIDF